MLKEEILYKNEEIQSLRKNIKLTKITELEVIFFFHEIIKILLKIIKINMI